MFGLEAVQKFLTGYADYFVAHRTIRSKSDLRAPHKLILALLEAVSALKLRVNPVKCPVLVKLAGEEAPAVMAVGCLMPLANCTNIGGLAQTEPSKLFA